MARILIADDTTFMRSTLRLYFEGTPHEVVGEARDGREAILQCKRHEVDVVLMDINMPGMNGFEATRRITQLRPDAKIIICSLYNSSDEVKQAYRAGASGYLSKPFSQSRLLNDIARLCPESTVDTEEELTDVEESDWALGSNQIQTAKTIVKVMY